MASFVYIALVRYCYVHVCIGLSILGICHSMSADVYGGAFILNAAADFILLVFIFCSMPQEPWLRSQDRERSKQTNS